MTVRNIFAETWDNIRNEGRAEGITLGREQGLNVVFSLVADGLVPLDEAAKRVNMSEDEFRNRMRARKG